MPRTRQYTWLPMRIGRPRAAGARAFSNQTFSSISTIDGRPEIRFQPPVRYKLFQITNCRYCFSRRNRVGGVAFTGTLTLKSPLVSKALVDSTVHAVTGSAKLVEPTT